MDDRPGTSRDNPVVRHAARILLLDDDDRLLLFRWQVPSEGAADSRTVWITPGGGLDAGETHEAAAVRELWEETGLQGVPIGPCVWERSHVFRIHDYWMDQRERYFVARAPHGLVDSTNWTREEQEWFREHRWWQARDIVAAREERFAPRMLGELLIAGLTGGFPAHPLVVDV
ncbi:MAG: NUDIX domain-containing protein [Dehalococcoidia bacterium]|nr:NUDIX domain-containing protein [Dehalococcoidia bacterium]